MGTKKILIIDDEQNQALALKKLINENVEGSDAFCSYLEEDIVYKIQNSFYNLLILDIRMDGVNFNGIDLAKMAFEYNPLSKIIFVSKFLAEYFDELSELLKEGRILGFSEKKNYDDWIPELSKTINDYYDTFSPNATADALLSLYSDTKNEEDTYKKGQQFEHFISLIMSNIGYKDILTRAKDAALNEVDLIVRNEIDDSFLSSFGRYLLIECKNKPAENTSKNDIIIFESKIRNTNGLAKLGFLFTTSTITKNSCIQLAKYSAGQIKIVVVDNVEIQNLIHALDMKEYFKKIIDKQVNMY